MNARAKSQGRLDIDRLSDTALLATPICDLAVTMPPWITNCVHRLYDELESKGIEMKPHVWFSDSWFCPDDASGFAIPFMLAHPRLVQLARRHQLKPEGTDPAWCMRLMRHETAHALDNAYLLRRFKRRQQVFGLSSTPYPKAYAPRLYSRSYVCNLDEAYAQAHPDEDWAETFAVWLDPESRWRKRYQRRSVLEKLQIVDEIMEAIALKRPAKVRRQKLETLDTFTMPLGEYYNQRKCHVFLEKTLLDKPLRTLFAQERRQTGRAEHFLRRNRKVICFEVAHATGLYQYQVSQILNAMIDRAKDIGLYVPGSHERTLKTMIPLLSARAPSLLAKGVHKIRV